MQLQEQILLLGNIFGHIGNRFGQIGNICGHIRSIFGHFRNIFAHIGNIFDQIRNIFGQIGNIFGQARQMKSHIQCLFSLFGVFALQRLCRVPIDILKENFNIACRQKEEEFVLQYSHNLGLLLSIFYKCLGGHGIQSKLGVPSILSAGELTRLPLVGFHIYFNSAPSLSLFWPALFAGLMTWSRGATLVDIEAELNTLSDCAPPGEEARGGETFHHLFWFNMWIKWARDIFVTCFHYKPYFQISTTSPLVFFMQCLWR